MMPDPLSEKYAYNSVFALQENKFAKGVELEGLELGDFVKGYLVSKIDNYSGGLINLRSSIKPKSSAAYNTGQDIGDLHSATEGATLDASGNAAMGAGSGIMAGSVQVEIGSGGTATVVAAPAAATGAVIGAAGAASKMFGKMLQASGNSNYGSQKGRAESIKSDTESGGTERMGKSNGNSPRNNQAQNEQTNTLSKKYNLSKKEQETLHRDISKKGYGYKEIEKRIQELFKPKE